MSKLDKKVKKVYIDRADIYDYEEDYNSVEYEIGFDLEDGTYDEITRYLPVYDDSFQSLTPYHNRHKLFTEKDDIIIDLINNRIKEKFDKENI